MSSAPSSARLVGRRERLAGAGAARARRDRRVGLAIVACGVAIWLVPLLVFVALWAAGTDLGNWPGTVQSSIVVVSVALLTYGRRMGVGGAERLLAEDARPPIV